MPAPVFVIAFANNPADPDRHLPALDAEFARLRDVLDDVSPEKRWELVPSAQTSIRSFLDLLQEEAYHNRIALLHFAGHANGQSLLLESEDGGVEVANAEGLAEFLAQHDGLGFLFLNACSTVGQVQALLAAGVPAIIATDFDINDAVATEFSARFYKEFVNGQTLRKAFNAAAAAVKTNLELKNAASTRSITFDEPQRDPGDWPWKLHVREGNERADQWSLGVALDDPLWGVPEPEERPLPASPFRHLLPFGAEHAAIFFGRRRETRQVYDAIERGDARRVVLLHGVSGAGKSSLLEAGLLPRLQRTREVLYGRRKPDKSLLGNLHALLGVAEHDDSPTALRDAWMQRETPERPLTIILDQVEEALGDPARDGKSELEALAHALKALFDHPNAPAGSIVLGFRKEWLAEIQSQLEAVRLASTSVFLDRLGTRGIVEAVEGVTRSAVLRAHYRLTIPPEDADLADEIADDLLTDATSAIAPTLQLLLTKMWERAEAGDGRHFTRALYRALVKEGTMLKDFVEQQLRHLHDIAPKVESSGLALDLLAFHASPLGDATRFRSSAERAARYPVALQPEVARIVAVASANRLMAVVPEEGVPNGAGATRLAHDTLARYVRELESHSAKPVQRAQRVLDERADDWVEDGMQRPLSAADLTLVERGLPMMRVLTPVEQRMLEVSRTEVQRAARTRRMVRMGFAAAAVVLAVVGSIAFVQGRKASLQAHRATVQALISSATNAADPLEAALMLTSLANEPDEPPGVVQAALAVLARPIPLHVMTGHTGLITAASFSPDGERVLTASSDSTVRIWSRDGARPPLVLRGHSAWITAAAWSADGKRVMSAANDSTVRLWSVSDTSVLGEPVVLRHDSPMATAIYCGREEWIVTASDTAVRLWRGDGTGVPVLLRGHTGAVTGLVCSPDGNRVLSIADDSTARMWQVTGASQRALVRRLSSRPLSAAFSADGRRVIAGIEDGSVAIWNADGSGRTTEMLNAFSAATAVAFSPNGKSIAVGTSDSEIRTGSSTGSGLAGWLSGHNGQIITVEYSADGEHLLTASMDGSARIWRTGGSDQSIQLAGHSGMVRRATYSPDGRWILTAGNDGTVRIWANPHDRTQQRATTVQVIDHGDEQVISVDYNVDGSRIVSVAGARAVVRSSDGGDHRIVLEGQAGMNTARFSPDGSHIVTAAHDGSVWIWAVSDSTANIVAKIDDGAAVLSAQYNLDGTMIGTGNVDGTIHVYRGSGGNPIAELNDHDAAVTTVAFSPNGERLVSGSDDLTARIWTLDGSVEPIVLRGFGGTVTSAAFSPDGAWLALASDDATVRVWKGDGTGTPVVLRGHSGAVHAVSWSPDLQFVLTASADGTARIARRDGSGTPLVLTGHNASVMSATYSPDGAHVLTASLDATERVWPVTWRELLGNLEASTTACLAPSARVRLLGETVERAATNARECETAAQAKRIRRGTTASSPP